jgi:hypothetical protein
MDTSKLIDSSTASLFEVPGSNSPLVVQELRTGGTGGAYGKQARRLFYDKMGGETARPPSGVAKSCNREMKMCRNIKTLFNFEPPATADEIHASALQFVRKLSGFSKPSQANAEAFDRAVAEVSAAAHRLLDSLHTHAPARDREIEAEKAKERSRARFA